MIDFHNHILPNFDDGSHSMEMSIAMLKHAYSQGITEVVNTVHFQHPKVEGIEISYQIIKQEIRKLQKELQKMNIPIKIHIGSEVFYLPNLMQIKDDPIATIGNGNYMLIEFQPYTIPDTHKQIFFDLKMEGITPVIAHPERYKPIQENINLVYEWLNAGCLIQVDAGSIVGTLGKSARIASEKIIKNKWCQILGSDAHDNRKRNFCLKDALLIAKQWIGDEADALVLDHPQALLDGKPIIVELDENYSEIRPPFWKRIYKKNRK